MTFICYIVWAVKLTWHFFFKIVLQYKNWQTDSFAQNSNPIDEPVLLYRTCQNVKPTMQCFENRATVCYVLYFAVWKQEQNKK